MNQYVAQRRTVLASSKSSNAPRPYLLCFSPYPINLRDAEPIVQIVATAAAARPRPAIHRETKRRDHFGRLSVPLFLRFRPDGALGSETRRRNVTYISHFRRYPKNR